MKALFLFTAFLVLMSCEKKRDATQDTDKSLSYSQECPLDHININSNCYNPRATTQIIGITTGTIELKGTDIWTIVVSHNQHYLPCNLPSSLKVNGLQISFSGETKEIYPYERWPATPFELNCYNTFKVED